MPRLSKCWWHGAKGGANCNGNDTNQSSRKETQISVYSVPTQHFSKVIANLEEMQELQGWKQLVEKESKHGGEFEQWDYKRGQQIASLHVYKDKLGNDWPEKHRSGTRPKGAVKDDDFDTRQSKGAQRGYRSMVVLSGGSTFGAEVHAFLYSWYAILKRPENETPDCAALKQVRLDHLRYLFGTCDRLPLGREAPAGPSEGKWVAKVNQLHSQDTPKNLASSSLADARTHSIHLSDGSWQVASPFAKVQKGIDLNSDTAGKLKRDQVCSQVTSGCLILILDSRSNKWHLRMPLDRGGWVTLGTRMHATAPIQTNFQNPAVDLDTLFQAAENFDELLLKAHDAWSQLAHQQHLLRCDGDQKLIADRNAARLLALEHARKICNSHLAERCRLDAWSGGGRREEAIDLMHQRISELEFGTQLDISREATKLEELQKNIRRTRCALKKADHELEFADVEYEHGMINIENLKAQKSQARLDARLAAKMYREQLEHFRYVVDVHAPEEFHRLATCELDFLQNEIEKAPPSLRAQIMRVFDRQQSITDFDQCLEEMRVISDHGACHMVYETTLEGKPCVLKRISLGSKDGLARLIKEIKYMVKLAHDDLTVPLQCAFRDRDWGYLQFQRYESDLLQWMELQQPSCKNWTRALCIVQRMIQAVGWVHSQNVIHGDLKPANFLLDIKTGLPRLHDFETAMEAQDDPVAVHASSSWTTVARGTPKYEAPEIKANRDIPRNKCTDVFALGVCIQDVGDYLLPPSSTESNQLRNLASHLTCTSPSDRLSIQQIGDRCAQMCQGVDGNLADTMTVEQAEERCRYLFSSSGYVMDTVMCSEVLFTQDACSSCFSDGTRFETLINAIVKEPSYPLQHESLILDVVIFRDQRRKPPRTYLHSVHNRRLHCFKEAQRQLQQEVKIRIRKYDFGPTFHRFLGHFDTTNQGKSIKIRSSYYDARSRPSGRKTGQTRSR